MFIVIPCLVEYTNSVIFYYEIKMEDYSLDTKRCWKKNVMLFLAGQTISLFGSSLVQFAITWYITLNTQSGMMLTISIICGFLPTLFPLPLLECGLTGITVNADNSIDALIALATLVLAVLFFIGYDKLWLLFVVSVIRSLGSSIQTPAVNAFIPQFVPDDKLVKVNARMELFSPWQCFYLQCLVVHYSA